MIKGLKGLTLASLLLTGGCEIKKTNSSVQKTRIEISERELVCEGIQTSYLSPEGYVQEIKYTTADCGNGETYINGVKTNDNYR